MKLRIKNILKENKEDRKDLMLKKLSSLIEPPLVRGLLSIYKDISKDDLKKVMDYYFNTSNCRISDFNYDYFLYRYDDYENSFKYEEYYQESLNLDAFLTITNHRYDIIIILDFKRNTSFIGKGDGMFKLHYTPFDILNEIRNGTFDFTKYLDFLNTRLTGGTLNESIDKKEETLNRIVHFMLQDTEWVVSGDGYYVEITFPGGERDHFNFNDMEVWDKFFMTERDNEYLGNHFGVTEKRIIQELYDRYIKILSPIIYEEMINYHKDNNRLIESVNKIDVMVNRIVDTLFDNTEWEFYPWGHEKNTTWNTGRDGLVTIWYYDRRDEDDHYFYGKKDVIEMVNMSKRISDDVSRNGVDLRELEYLSHTYGLTEEESVMVLNRYARRLWNTLYDLYWNKDHIDYVGDYNK